MIAISRLFHDRTTAEAAVQDLCDAGFMPDDMEIATDPVAVRLTVRTPAARAARAAEVLDRHTAAGAPAGASGPGDAPGPTTDDVRREREAAWSGEEGGTAASAARFGAEMAANPRYGDADWTIVEPEARRQWRERGTGPWDAVRDEIRSAWERTRGPDAA